MRVGLRYWLSGLWRAAHALHVARRMSLGRLFEMISLKISLTQRIDLLEIKISVWYLSVL